MTLVGGNYCGTTYAGGTGTCVAGSSSIGCGTVFSLNGNLYGTAYGGGSHGCGVLFEVTTDGKLQVLYDFGANAKDGEFPNSALVVANGSLYGATEWGGKHQNGTIFEFTP